MNHRVLVLEHLSGDGPAYLGRWLHRHGFSVDVRNSEAGDVFPSDLHGYCAMAILGGAMSANDDLPSLRQAEELIREGVHEGVPVIGHCLGGQLMARALGAKVLLSPVPEVGWHEVQLSGVAEQKKWFGDAASATVFQWHDDAFDLPAGAVHLAGNGSCPNQAFSLGPHLAMQFHLEIDANKLDAWLTEPEPGYERAQQLHPTVQSVATIRDGATRFLAAQQALADRIYAQWMSSARR